MEAWKSKPEGACSRLLLQHAADFVKVFLDVSLSGNRFDELVHPSQHCSLQYLGGLQNLLVLEEIGEPFDGLHDTRLLVRHGKINRMKVAFNECSVAAFELSSVMPIARRLWPTS